MFSFRKEERLCSKISINTAFSKGKRTYNFPLQAISLFGEFDFSFPAQVLITVPKKKIKKSVDRNLIKRRMREAYRLNKHMLYQHLQNKNKKIILVLLYQHESILDFKIIEKSIIAIFEKIEKQG